MPHFPADLLAELDSLPKQTGDRLKSWLQRFVDDQQVGQTRSVDKNMGRPTDSQMEAILSLTDEESTPEDWYVMAFRASDNFVDRGLYRWHPNVQVQMGMDFSGKPLILDHQHNTSNIVGFLMSPSLVRESSAPEEILNSIGMGAANQEIVRNEGYLWLYTMGVLRAGHPAVEDVRSRRFNDVSTGSSLQDVRRICPNCTREKGREVDFFELDKNNDYACPHLIPDAFSRAMFEMFGDRDDNPQWAEYCTLDGTSRSVELSFCLEGMLPGASLLRAGPIVA